jgi:hypothetical protein
MTTMTIAPAAAPTPEPDHEPWCCEHWDGVAPGEPGTCFARDGTIPVAGDEVEVAMSATPGQTPSLTLFLPSRPILDAPNFASGLAEVETAADALLAQVARARRNLAACARHTYSAGRAARNGDAR